MPETAFTASNALYNGQARGFEDACDLAERAAHEEQRSMVRLQARFRSGPRTPAEAVEDADYLRSLDEYAEQARRAKSIYRELLAGVTPAAVARLRAEGLDEFADALASGDWSKLAI